MGQARIEVTHFYPEAGCTRTLPTIFQRIMSYLPLELSEAVPLPRDRSAYCMITERGTGML